MRHEAIYSLYKEVAHIDDATGAFDKDWKKVDIDETKVSEEIKKLKDEFNSKEYARNRQTEYERNHSIGDQLDYIFHHGIDKWKTDIIQPIKVKYPKPT